MTLKEIARNMVKFAREPPLDRGLPAEVWAGKGEGDPEVGGRLEQVGSQGVTSDERVPAALQPALKRLRQNLGRLDNEQLRRLRMAIKASKFVCRTCQSCSRPSLARPSRPVVALDFGEALGVDVVHLDDSLGNKNYGLNLVNYASTPTKAVRDAWIMWAGPPRSFSLDLPLPRCAASATRATCRMRLVKRIGSMGWWNGILACGKRSGRGSLRTR